MFGGQYLPMEITLYGWLKRLFVSLTFPRIQAVTQIILQFGPVLPMALSKKVQVSQIFIVSVLALPAQMVESIITCTARFTLEVPLPVIRENFTLALTLILVRAQK